MRSRKGLELVSELESHPRTWSSRELENRWGSTALRAASRSESIVQLLPGRWCATTHSVSMFTRAHAATVALGKGSALIGVNAAAVWGWVDAQPDRMTVSARHGAKLAGHDWITVRRRADPVEQRYQGGLAVCALSVAVITAQADVHPRDGDELLYASIRSGLTTTESLRNELAEWRYGCHRQRVSRALNLADSGCESVLEADAARGAFRGAAFSDWVRQHRLLLDGVQVRMDMYHPASRTAIEIDGARFHSSPDAVAADIRRGALLATHGIQVVRFGTRDLRGQPGWCREAALRTVEVRQDATTRAS